MEIIVKGIRIKTPFERGLERIEDFMPRREFDRKLTEVNTAWFRLLEKKLECAGTPDPNVFSAPAKKAAGMSFSVAHRQAVYSSRSGWKINF